MNREIKFRAWDQINKKFIIGDDYWINFEGKVFIDNGYHMPIDISSLEDHPLRFILLQYTGLKDRDGKEIYEGDIVRLMEKRSYIVKWDINHYLHPMPYQEMLSVGTPTSRVESENGNIIGNIHQNPELLEKTDERE